MRAVNRVVEANLDFQSKQTDFQHDLKIKQTKSEGRDEDELGGFYLPQKNPDAHRNSMSPQRKPSYKKKSAYGNRRTMPYVPSNRPITPNLQKQNSNLLSDNSGSSNNLGSLQFQGKLMSQNTSP